MTIKARVKHPSQRGGGVSGQRRRELLGAGKRALAGRGRDAVLPVLKCFGTGSRLMTRTDQPHAQCLAALLATFVRQYQEPINYRRDFW